MKLEAPHNGAHQLHRRVRPVTGTHRWHRDRAPLDNRAHAVALAGGSAFPGVERFAASNHVHTTRILSLPDDLPIAIKWGRSSVTRASLSISHERLTNGLVIVERVEVITYVGRTATETQT